MPSLFARSVSLRASILAAGFVAAACSSAPSGGSMPSGDPSSSGNSTGGANGNSTSGSSGNGNAAGSGEGAGNGGAATGGTSGSSSGSAGASGSSSAGTSVPGDTTWADGMTIPSALTIPAGVTVKIASGATITLGNGVTITVAGTLTSAPSPTHAKLTGSGWTGLVIAAGGTLTADSLDFSGATTPLDVAGTATYSNGTITAPTTPVDVETGGMLTLTAVTVTGSLGFSRVNGSLTATQLDYDSNGNEGLIIGGAASVVNITSSKFHGTSVNGGDMISVNACASLTMSYTLITACHCAYHFNQITSFDLENMDLTGDSFGFMMYGSSPTSGTRVFKNSNVEDMAAAGIDELGTNGAITVSGVYFDSSSVLQLSDQEVTITDPASAPLPATSVGPQ